MSTASSLALLRVEAKLDLLLVHLRGTDEALNEILAQLGPTLLERSNEDHCPVCSGKISIRINPATEEYERLCACRPPALIMPGISKLTRDPAPIKKRVTEPDDEDRDLSDLEVDRTTTSTPQGA